MIAFRWIIDGMLRADEAGRAGVVTSIRFTLSGEQDGREGRVSGTFTPPMPEPGAAFTDFADLTETQVCAWLEAMPIAADLRAMVRSQIETMEVVAAGLPWLNEDD